MIGAREERERESEKKNKYKVKQLRGFPLFFCGGG